ITRFREDSVFEPTLAPSLPSTTVPVLFQLNSPSLGSWDLTKAVPLKWMPGDFWCGLAFLPDSELVEFKFVLLDAHNGYRAKGWANDVSGPGNLTMDVRRSGCLLAKGQVRAHAATPELSTGLQLPVSFESATAASMVADMVGADEELPVAPLDSGTTPITGRTTYNVGSATAARLYLEMFGGSSSGSG
ncbi:hypothetical protein HaLaN_21961, partial [Haematococcus lacustris]